MLKTLIKKLLRELSNCYETLANPKIKYENSLNQLDGWSVVVITDGKSNDRLTKLILSVKNELQNTPYEIVLVGPNILNKLNIEKNIPIKNIIYKELNLPKVPAWITKKKNLGISRTIYNKNVVCHDYIVFNSGWKKGYDNFKDDFEVCSNIIIDIDGERSTDWLTWDYPGLGQALLPYDKECTKYQYICGIYFVAKRDFLIRNPQLEELRWGESEDIRWSEIIRKKAVFKINTQSVVQFTKVKWKLDPKIYESSLELENLLNN